MPAYNVISLPRKKPQPKGKPAHWVDETHSKFQNPWDSWHLYPPSSRIVPYMTFTALNPTYPDPDKVQLPTVRTPNWGVNQKNEMKDKIKSTWLGHACFLVELPARSPESRGARVLFDPVFSKRCSSNQMVGPKRYTPAPCNVEEIPDVDAIVISHDHYDHMDEDTLKTIFKRDHKPLIFAPLNNESFLLKDVKAPEKNVHIMDWWDSKRVDIVTTLATISFDITCTPCQHFTGRKIWDDFQTLWASWVIESPSPSLQHQTNGTAIAIESRAGKVDVTPGTSITSAPSAKDGPRPCPTGPSPNRSVKVYFAGDTGYRAVKDDDDEDAVATCPVFKEIGDVFSDFDFAMIPIGAYLPRKVMSPIHCAPQDSVRIFKDIHARKALGMHWGTWILTTEPVDEPPKKLAEECKKAGIPHDDFIVCDIGETRFW